MKNALFTACCVAALAVVGCAAMTTESCLSRVAGLEVGITAAYKMTGRLLSTNVIGGDDALTAVKIIDGANVAADAAAPLCDVNEREASNFIGQAAAALIDVKSIIGDYNAFDE